jgi:Fe-S-cluster containining protein
MACQRCGECCHEFCIPVPGNDYNRYADFFAYHGMKLLRRSPTLMEVYGKADCVHFQTDEARVATCGIHETRPPICRDWLCPKCE